MTASTSLPAHQLAVVGMMGRDAVVERRRAGAFRPARADGGGEEVGVFAQCREVERRAESGADETDTNRLDAETFECGVDVWLWVAHGASWLDRGTARSVAGLGASGGRRLPHRPRRPGGPGPRPLAYHRWT